MNTIGVDKEVITRYIKEYLKHGDSAELAGYLLGEVKNEKDKSRAMDLLEYAIMTIRNRAQGIE